jgi:hypothetical protein
LLLQSLLSEAFLKETLFIDAWHPVREAPILACLFIKIVKEGETPHSYNARVEMLMLGLLGLACT